ncbi:MAG: nucleotidyltransferase family protein [Chloroflexota bacterium]|nr:nucleotidyltransferase family protein [Chloroflexota bacterium]MDE2883523.1 nucleotidyltransferase family protein [Chloroflexota bacterium]
MNRSELLRLLQAHRQTLSERFGVASLAVFGSFARDEATDDSDLDILVTFDGPATSRSYFGVQFYIEDLTGRTVDLVTAKALRPELRPSVERDWVRV